MSGPDPETGTPPATGATEAGLAGASGRGVAGGGGSDVPQLVGRAGAQIFFPSRERYHDLLAELQVEGFEMLADLCGVDYLTHPGRTLPAGVEPERFEVAVVLRRLDPPGMVRIRVQVPESDPVLASAWDLYPGVEAMERECFDMFGIRFVGHPDLTRILMPEDWEGHPLRKDYGVGRVPVQFKEAPGPR